jgi:hypothetical protein
VRRKGCRSRADGICWFTDGAREAVARAFTLAALLRECGVPVSKFATQRPGQILCGDAYQVERKAGTATSVGWQ